MKIGTKLLTLLLLLSTFNAFAKSIAEFTKGMEQKSGFFNLYYDNKNDKIYVEVDKLNQTFIFQSSLPQGLGSNDIGLDRGQLGDTRIVQFERYGNKVLLNQVNTYYRADTDNQAESQSVKEAFAKSVIQGFTVSAETNGTVLIDYTKYLLSDIHGVKKSLARTKQGSYTPDSSRSAVFMPRTKSFPKNTELEAIVSFKGSKPGRYLRDVSPDAENITVHMHHSFIELPDDNYTPRKFHPYSGYWSVEYKDYAAAIEDDMSVKFIPRHRLTKKDPNAAKSEAVKPIVYYLDPGAPEPVKSALIDGAMWWDQAFEAAGYINAFKVEILPEDADPMDVRYNTIQWVHRATRGWSYGSSVIDPRTGEIIKGHVSLGSLRVRQDYLIGQGLTAPFENGNKDTSKIKEMALARIRQLSAHEVGHTLGIAHNFAASVNDRASVMDYPHPLVKIKNGKIDLSDAYDDKIGEWDKFVIQYGYSDFASNEAAELDKLVAGAQTKGLLYMSDPDARPLSGSHPDGHLWDNGDNAATELERVLEVRKLALSNFGLGNLADGRANSDLQEVLVPIFLFHRFQTEAAVKLIAGVDYNYQVKGENTNNVAVVDKARQAQAFDAMLSTLSAEHLTLPQHIIDLIPPKAYGSYRNRESAPTNTGLVFDPIALASAATGHSLKGLLNSQRLNRISQQAAMGKTPWTLAEYLDRLITHTVKANINSDLTGVVQQRIAALTVEQMMQTLLSDQTTVETKAELFSALSELNTWLSPYTKTTGFYRLMAHHLNWYFEHRTWTPLVKPTAMPPGSPI
jgi:hypothetical protein